MNTDYINKLVELITSPIVTPYNLIEYLKLDNYKSINLYKEENSIVAKVTFISYDTIENSLFYLFNHNNELLEIYQLENANKVICFNRETEKNKIIDKLNSSSDLVIDNVSC